MRQTFYKYHGTGNDFIVLEDLKQPFPLSPLLISQICQRNTGIGADGLLLLQTSSIGDAKMRIFNQDGKEASMCGNGLRCLVSHLSKNCTIETKHGLCLGKYTPPFIEATLPQKTILQLSIPLESSLIGHLVDTGTKHLVIFTETLNDPKLLRIASRLRSHPNFQSIGGVNVSLAKIFEKGIQVRTFEKGLFQETLSCGSGGAAVCLLYKLYHQKNTCNIFYPHAELQFFFDEKDRLWMRGEVSFVFEGQLDTDYFSERSPLASGCALS